MFPMAKRGIVASTQLLGSVTRRLPGSADRPSPPRFLADSTVDYVATHPGSGIAVTEVTPTIELYRPQPDGLPRDHFAFAHHRRATVPATIVARLPGGRAVGPYGAVVTSGDTLLFDLSPYYGAFRPSQHPIFLQWRLPPVRDVAGSVGVLTTRGVDNYYHFLTDVLPRLELLRRAGIEPDRYLVNRSTGFQRELLTGVRMAEERTIQSSLSPHIRADELVVPSLPDSHLRSPPWIATWLRDTFLPGGLAAPHRRIYLGRGNRKHTRRVENEPEVLAALEPFGFESVDPGRLSVAEQIRLFAEAELVVGVHGAALTNLVFCSPGAAVIELFPPDYVNVCYWNLASSVEGIRYRYVVGDGMPKPVRPMHGVASDVTLDPGQIVRIVNELI
jgi:capsular polysaccharide biosynthesis protein